MKRKQTKTIPSIINIDGEVFNYILKISCRSRMIRLAIDNQKTISLSIPYYVPVSEGEAFFRNKVDWLKKKIKEIEQKMEGTEKYRGDVWKKILFLGKEYTIDIIYTDGENAGFFLGNNSIIFH
ncbi:MAG TPA: DUF45 domain-containing protein, partial [Firmicutes bacterium]|nr:DUF45 domain-containing protein [Bacillota bacterium]